ncbi:hypothetical protein [Trabulsiella odontotermitis]|uniref:hypothetical protein n=1 Tax=Trabulsiella odontotermitis TaxID=379893 RepID=UPI00092D1FBA|nr:hypothetical protein [Trabulsiella odontotermitis]
MTILTTRERARLRKQRSRASLAKQEGVNRFEVSLTDSELAALERGRVNRNPGREPYSRNEYIALLLINDAGKLAEQESALPVCGKCGAKPPQHCEGAFKGESTCWLTISCLKLNLTSVTGHS